MLITLSCAKDQLESVSDIPEIDLTDPTTQAIYDLQDKREGSKLIQYLNDENPSYRYLAAQALASVESPNTSNALENVLRKESYEVIRSEAAFAIGQTGSKMAVKSLKEAAISDPSLKVKQKALEAIGKAGDGEDLNYLVSLSFENNEVTFGQVLGIYRMSLRNNVNGGSIQKMVGFLNAEYPANIRIVAANYLARLSGMDLMSHVNPIIDVLENDEDPVVRANMAIALNKTSGSRARTVLIKAIKEDPDYRVRVNAARSLVYYGYDDIREALFTALEDDHVQVKVAVSESFLLISQRKDAARYALAASKAEDWLPKANMLKAALKYADGDLKEKINGFLNGRLRSEPNPYAKAAYIEALSGDLNNYPQLAGIAFSANPVPVTTAVMQGLNRMRIAEEYEDQLKASGLDREKVEDDFLQIYKRGIASGETTLTAVAAIALRNPDLNFRSKVDDIEFLRDAQENLILPREMETYIELQKTIDFFEGKDLSKNPETPYNNPIDWAYLQDILSLRKARILTSKGEMLVELYHERAPGTVVNFVKLSREGFYDSLSFHRVVPNFVAQGGCPRGDGYGSTEYSIRSEFANHYFREGSLGIASAGKDTESCQWFVTHFPTHHLDGDYTNFASVIEGMDVAHSLEIGDRILKIEFMN